MPLTQEMFGTTADGQSVTIFTLASGAVSARVMTYGGTLVSLHVPDRDGRAADVLLGFDTLDGYLAGHPYFGSLVGRFANRIAGGVFELDGVRYTLARNNGANHLHGGVRGFDKVIWQAEPLDSEDAPGVRLRYVSQDGEEGYPGTLAAVVTYTLTAAGELRLDYEATTDRPTIVNVTNHAYFNLAGSGDIFGHLLEIPADTFLPTDSGQIPTGELRSVAGTPLDFRNAETVGARIHADDEQLRLANGGYDHTYVLGTASGVLRLAARLSDPASGREIEALTTEPAVQLYTGNMLDGTIIGKSGQIYHKHAGLCLETQHYPDTPNQPAFPSTRLAPGEVYRQTTVYRVGVKG